MSIKDFMKGLAKNMFWNSDVIIEHKFPTGVLLQIKHVDIVDEKADVLVCPVDPRLGNTRGQIKRVVDIGGWEI